MYLAYDQYSALVCKLCTSAAECAVLLELNPSYRILCTCKAHCALACIFSHIAPDQSSHLIQKIKSIVSIFHEGQGLLPHGIGETGYYRPDKQIRSFCYFMYLPFQSIQHYMEWSHSSQVQRHVFIQEIPPVVDMHILVTFCLQIDTEY
jgi:hypothetical protein